MTCIYRLYIYNADISDHPDLDLPILYLYKVFTGKFALCLGLLLLFPRYRNQANIIMSGNTIPGCMSISMDHWIFSEL